MKNNMKLLLISLIIANIFTINVYAGEIQNTDLISVEETQEVNETQVITMPETSEQMESSQQENSNDEFTVNDARNGILQVNLVYIDDDNVSHLVRGGSGFLVGNEEGADYIITSNTNIQVTNDLRTSVGKEYKVAKSERKNMQFGIQVVVKRDVVITASLTTSSEQLNFAVLKLAQTIYDRKPLQIEKNPEMTKEMESVYTLGFPEEIQNQQDVSYYTYEDVSVMNGIVSKKVTLDGTVYIQHSASVTNGNAGGPTLNQYGQVIGINQIIMEDGYNYSVHISEITSVLDALGIPYTEVVQKPVIEQVDTSALETAIVVAKEKNLDGYTRESVAEYNDVLHKAEVMLANKDITNEQVTSGLALVSSADSKLVIENNNHLFLIALMIIVALIFMLILVIIIMIKKNSKINVNDNEHEAEKDSKIKKKSKNKNKTTYEELVQNPPFQPAIKITETSLLNGEMGFDEGETTILEDSMQSGETLAVLRRLKNNEIIEIKKVVFYLGKDSLKVDYCIVGNNAISRNHAVIKQIDKEFYLEDLQATNGTYHNDVRLGASQSVKLISGDRIKLANEEFVITI